MRPRALKILAHGGVSVLVREQVAGRLPPSAVLMSSGMKTRNKTIRRPRRRKRWRKKREVVGEVTCCDREHQQLYACRAGNSPRSCADPSAEDATGYFFLNSPTTAHN